MTVELPEFRRMLEAGSRYLAGTCAIQELNGCASDLALAVKFWGGHPAVAQVAAEWSSMIDRRWNEWGHNPAPLSEQEFLGWLNDQLTLLGPMSNNSFKVTPDGAPQLDR